MLSSCTLSRADMAVAISPKNVAVGVAIQSWHTARRPYQRKQPTARLSPSLVMVLLSNKNRRNSIVIIIEH